MWRISHNHCGGNLACIPVEVNQGADRSTEICDSIEDGAENLDKVKEVREKREIAMATDVPQARPY
jgi:hypothetical protein